MSLSRKGKKGGSITRDPFQEQMEDLIQDWDLIDVKSISHSFTCSNKRTRVNHIEARLDGFLVQSEWPLQGISISTKVIASLTSDHTISLELVMVENLGQIPYRFNHLWLKEEKAKDIILQEWGRPILGSPSYVWEKKL